MTSNTLTKILIGHSFQSGSWTIRFGMEIATPLLSLTRYQELEDWKASKRTVITCFKPSGNYCEYANSTARFSGILTEQDALKFG
jgi:hypothetical protein